MATIIGTFESESLIGNAFDDEIHGDGAGGLSGQERGGDEAGWGTLADGSVVSAAEADTAASTRFLSPIVRPSSRRSSSLSDATTSRSTPLSRKLASSRDRPKRASHSLIVVDALMAAFPGRRSL